MRWMIWFLLAQITFGAWGQDTGVRFREPRMVRVATLIDYPPLCFVKEGAELRSSEVILPRNDSSVLQGLAWEVVRDAYQSMGYGISLTAVPWARAMAMFEAGGVDILFPAVKTPEREARFQFSRERVYPPGHFLIYGPASSPLEWKGLESLAGKRVGAMWGFSYGPKWDAFARTQSPKVAHHYGILQGFKLMDQGHLDYLVGYEMSYETILRQGGLRDNYKRFPAFDEQHSHVMGQSGVVGKGFLDAFDQGKARLRASGRLKAILAKYGFEHLSE